MAKNSVKGIFIVGSMVLIGAFVFLLSSGFSDRRGATRPASGAGRLWHKFVLPIIFSMLQPMISASPPGG